MAARVLIVGLGRLGSQIAHLLLADGYTIAGAADPSHAGRRLGDVVDAVGVDTLVHPDTSSLLAAVTGDVAIVTAPVGIEDLRTITFELFDAGVNVLTIHPDVFDPPAEWAATVDERAKANGVSFLSTGVQDVWWVTLPAVLAASVRRLERIRTDDVVDAGQLWPGLGKMIGIGRPPADFPGIRDEVLTAKTPVLAGALRLLARRLDLTPLVEQHSVAPVVAAETLRWSSADTIVEPGLLSGYVEHAELTTMEGVALGGSVRASLLIPGEAPRNSIEFQAEPSLRFEVSPFPGNDVTVVAPISRIRDIIAAPAGLHTVATLPPARYAAPFGARTEPRVTENPITFSKERMP